MKLSEHDLEEIPNDSDVIYNFDDTSDENDNFAIPLDR